MMCFDDAIQSYNGKAATSCQEGSLKTDVCLLAWCYCTWVGETVIKCSPFLEGTQISFPWKDKASSWRPAVWSSDFCPLKCRSPTTTTFVVNS